MATEKHTDWLKTWEALGFDFSEERTSNNEAVTYNPFDGHQDKMYVNTDTGQWIAYGGSGKSGNVYTFVHEYFELCLKETKLEDVALLAEEKQLPPQAFLGEVAYNPQNGTFLVPFRNYEGQVRGLQYYKLGGSKCFNVKNLPTQLWNTQDIKKKPGRTIWLCEGAWDGMALKWAFKSCGEDSVVIALQGGNPYGFKEAFIPLMNKRKLFVCYDKDNAGFEGEERVFNLLYRSVTSELRFIAWPDILKDKYDIRDFILDNGGKPEYPRIALRNVVNTLETLMNKQTKKQRLREKGKEQEPRKDIPIPTREEVEGRFNKWLKMKNNDPLAVMFGTIFANRLSNTNPIWMFFVAPPAGMKTELVSKLTKSPRITTVNKLTPAGMISGFQFKSGEDPSLLTEADGKTLVITDFTTIIDGNRLVRDEIFSILRDAYDGRVEKQYAKFKKTIESNFGIIAATTPVIDAATSINASLGERFLKYRLDKDHTELDEDERMYRAMANVGEETKMGDELKDLCFRFLEKPMPEKLPIVSPEHKLILIKLAKFAARARAQVVEDQFGETQVMPFSEFGTRLVKQFMKIAMGISIYFDEPETVKERTITIVKEIALDTCPQITIEILKSIYCNNKEKGKCANLDIVNDVSVSGTTITRRTGRMVQLDIIQKVTQGFGSKMFWGINPTVIELIETAKLFKVKTPPKPKQFTLKKP